MKQRVQMYSAWLHLLQPCIALISENDEGSVFFWPFANYTVLCEDSALSSV